MSVYIEGTTDTIRDTNNLTNLAIAATASAVNYLISRNAATATAPRLEAAGTDANIDLELRAKGTGHTVVPAGVPGTTATTARLGGTLNSQFTAVGNVGSGEDDLMSYTVPANVLGTNGDRLRVTAHGDFAANANNKRIRLKYGATTILDTTALAINGDQWYLDATIIRTGATAQIASARINSADALLLSQVANASPAETLSGTVILKLTGEATSDNDVRQLSMHTEWCPV